MLPNVNAPGFHIFDHAVNLKLQSLGFGCPVNLVFNVLTTLDNIPKIGQPQVP